LYFGGVLEPAVNKLLCVFSADFPPLFVGKILACLWARGEFHLLDWRKIVRAVADPHNPLLTAGS
jgi:hypothetical protein